MIIRKCGISTKYFIVNIITKIEILIQNNYNWILILNYDKFYINLKKILFLYGKYIIINLIFMVLILW